MRYDVDWSVLKALVKPRQPKNTNSKLPTPTGVFKGHGNMVMGGPIFWNFKINHCQHHALIKLKKNMKREVRQHLSIPSVHETHTQWRSQRGVGGSNPPLKNVKKNSEDKIVENTQSWSLHVLMCHQTTSLTLTDLQILGCELQENAFGVRAPPGPAGGAIALSQTP